MVVTAGREVAAAENPQEGARAKSPTAARILAAAQELALKRGFRGVTVSAIAEKALIGKGTIYLYWNTKEELFLALLARSFLTIVDALIEKLAADSALVSPDRFCLLLLGACARHPLVRALQAADVDLLGSLARDERTYRLLRQHGAAALLERIIPVWRACGLASQAADPSRQAYALQMLCVGYAETGVRPITADTRPGSWRDEVMAGTVTNVLGGSGIDSSMIGPAAAGVLKALGEHRLALSAIV